MGDFWRVGRASDDRAVRKRSVELLEAITPLFERQPKSKAFVNSSWSKSSVSARCTTFRVAPWLQRWPTAVASKQWHSVQRQQVRPSAMESAAEGPF